MKKIFVILASVATLFFTTGCEKFQDCNKNVDAPDYVDDYLYLAGCLSAFQGCYFDIRALGGLTSMTTVASGYSNFAAHYYNAGSDAGGELWRVNYFLLGMNLENMIHQAEAREAWTLAGMGYAIKAFSWDGIAKYHGQAPLKQAYEFGRFAFDYDSDKDIMAASREWAEKAIEYLEKEDLTDYGTTLKEYDIAYHGDKEKWVRFAHSVIVCDLAALTNKADFAEKYAEDLIEHASKAFVNNNDNFIVEREGKGKESQFSAYNNFWGTFRGNLVNAYKQSEYIVRIMTGTVPEYDENGDLVKTENVTPSGDPVDPNYKYKLAEKQIISDTTNATGHYDPRIIGKLASEDTKNYDKMSDKEAIKDFYFPASGGVPNIYGFRNADPTTAVEGAGRWLFRDDAPYILLTASEIKFELAEAFFTLGRKGEALEAWKEGVRLDMDFTAKYLNPGAPKKDANDNYIMGGNLPGGSAITVATFNELAAEYLAGPYVAGVTVNDLTLSHIMMQKYVALWPWGALEAWTDLRKYHYDIKYTGDYPGMNNGWDLNKVDQKMDNDPTKVYKGFYLAPAQVEGRKSKFSIKNEGSPCYRVRPRYNSEYMWNKEGLGNLKPISGLADNYHCSIPWFAYPGEYPESL